MNQIVAFHPARDCFNKVVCNKGTRDQDYWFVWEGDYEPIRISLQNDAIIEELHRIHWIHKSNQLPYSDEQKRVHILFWTLSHTPQVKASKNDRIFEAIVKSFNHEIKEQYDLTNEDVPIYYTEKGMKPKHLPPVYYNGWPTLV